MLRTRNVPVEEEEETSQVKDMRIILRVKRTKPALVAPAISAKEITGDSSPVPSFGMSGSSTYVDRIPALHATSNQGKYTPPPKNPIWAAIPAQMLKTGGCGCKE